MTDLFTKLKRTLEADLYEIMETKDKKHPLYKLNQYLRESENEVGQVQRLIERQYRLKNEVKREHQTAYDMAQKRKGQHHLDHVEHPAPRRHRTGLCHNRSGRHYISTSLRLLIAT